MIDTFREQARILIIDDDRVHTKVLTRILQDHGYCHLQAAANPLDALRLWEEFQPDLIVLDWMMPEMGGHEVLGRIRALIPAETYLPILVVTASSDIETKRQALAGGATDFLAKPFDPSEIVLRVGNLLETRFLHRQLAARHDAALHKEREFLAAMLDHAQAGIVACDAQGVLTVFNRFTRELHGLPEEPLPASEWAEHYDLFLADGKTRMMKEEIPLFRALQGEMVRDVQMVVAPRHNGTRRTLRASGQAIFGNAGEKLGAVVVMHDITDRMQTEENLRRSEARLTEAQKTARIGSWEWDVIQNTVLWSDEIFRIFGLVPGSFTPGYDDWLRCVHPDDRKSASEHVNEALRTQKPAEFEYRVMWPDGQMRIVHSRVATVPDHSGAAARMVGTVQDISERKRAEDQLRSSEDRFRSVTESVGDGIISCDGDSRIVFWNHAAESLFGHRADEALGQPLTIIMPERFRAMHVAGMARFRASGQARVIGKTVELVGLRKDGAEFPIELTVSTWKTAEGAFYTGIVRDIAERKQAQEALQNAHHDLEIRVQERTAELLAAKVEAESANHAKSEFLSRMSHELRTPLNAILGFGQVLEMNPLDAQPRDCVKHILKAGGHLLGLINEVLDLSGIEAGRVTYSIDSVRVQDVVRESLDLIRPLAAARAMRLEAPADDPSDAHVLADRQRMKQVIVNLLANAVKYGGDGGRAKVAWREQGAGRLRILVEDNGQGIAADKLERLFSPFERLGAELTDTEGSGLGLALSKKLIEAMGGAIGVETKVGQGSIFWIDLPRCPSPLARIHAAGEPEDVAEEAAGTILYIEDNLSNLTLIEFLFSHRPQIKLLAAMQGRSGIELAREHRPDLILLDLHLPDMMGDEVLAELKNNPRTTKIPVAMLTADATPAQEKRLLAAGANDFLTKPINVPRLLRLIENTVGQAAGNNSET